MLTFANPWFALLLPLPWLVWRFVPPYAQSRRGVRVPMEYAADFLDRIAVSDACSRDVVSFRAAQTAGPRLGERQDRRERLDRRKRQDGKDPPASLPAHPACPAPPARGLRRC